MRVALKPPALMVIDRGTEMCNPTPVLGGVTPPNVVEVVKVSTGKATGTVALTEESQLVTATVPGHAVSATG
jgi:hypothetical protein